MSDSIDRVFAHALNTIKKIPRTGSARPPLADRLKLYGLYKQSMEGNVQIVMDRPSNKDQHFESERQKWDAWYEQRDLTRTEAKRRYITVLIDVMRKYASSSEEARELISELEFVWDQVKHNTPSQRRTEPKPQRLPPPPGYHESGIPDEEEDEAVDNSRNAGLRVMSPHSQPIDDSKEEVEEEEEEDDDDEAFEEARDSFYEDDGYDDYDYSYDSQLEVDRAHPSKGQEEPAPKVTRTQPVGVSRVNNGGGNSNANVCDSLRRPSTMDRHHLLNVESGQRRPGPGSGLNPGLDPNKAPERASTPKPSNRPPAPSRRWRRRVGTALYQITTELAAIREQMQAQTRPSHSRWSLRPKSIWRFTAGLAWSAFSHVCWDMFVLVLVLLVMRARGDRRLEEKLREGWRALRRRFPAVGFYFRQFKKLRFLAF